MTLKSSGVYQESFVRYYKFVTVAIRLFSKYLAQFFWGSCAKMYTKNWVLDTWAHEKISFCAHELLINFKILRQARAKIAYFINMKTICGIKVECVFNQAIRIGKIKFSQLLKTTFSCRSHTYIHTLGLKRVGEFLFIFFRSLNYHIYMRHVLKNHATYSFLQAKLNQCLNFKLIRKINTPVTTTEMWTFLRPCLLDP